MKKRGLGAGGRGLGRQGFRARDSGFGQAWQQLALIILAAILLAGCHAKPAAQTLTAFPESNEVPGWTKWGATRTFSAANLYEYIDGAADKFIQAGVKRVQTSDYHYQKDVEATADIYTMDGPQGARKVFESESSPESKQAAVGDLAQLSKSSLIFVKGSHYVKLVAYQESPDVAKALVDLGQAIAGKLGP